MPCTDNYTPNYFQRDGYSNHESYSNPTREESLEKDLRNLLRENENLAKENVLLEAQLCALLTELYKNGLDIVVTTAEQNGQVDIKSFWAIHQKKDESKINKILRTLSKHERDLLKKKLG